MCVGICGWGGYGCAAVGVCGWVCSVREGVCLLLITEIIYTVFTR